MSIHSPCYSYYVWFRWGAVVCMAILSHHHHHHHHGCSCCQALTTTTSKSRTGPMAPARTIRSSTDGYHHQLVCCAARPYHRRPYRAEEYDDDDRGDAEVRATSREERQTARPTQTRPETLGPSVGPSRPHIVVLGATGLIGRRVVRQLLDRLSPDDATIVAFVRDYDKACRVLYDDQLLTGAHHQTSSPRQRGPTLQIVQGDLVSHSDLPGYGTTTDSRGIEEEEEEERDWLRRAESTATFYGTRVNDYDNRVDGGIPPLPDEALSDVIRDCTTINSCVGAVRPTNVWTDYLARPLWRLLRRDVSGWCRDPRHPFYVHYQTTRKVLHMAEREQLRREARHAAEAEAVATRDGDTNDGTGRATNVVVPRIRFIRISDLCVAQPSWHFIPVLTNILHSMVFRYQEMTEKILERSSLIETITLRPGDLVDDERDANTTSLQVDPSGSLPCPARVGRDDVAALAVASALFNSNRDRQANANTRLSANVDADDDDDEPFHYTLACRWVGDQMDPYPAQGCLSDGLANANDGLQAALQKLQAREKPTRRRRRGRRRRESPTIRNRSFHHTESPFAVRLVTAAAQAKPLSSSSPPRNIKPYGICVAIPVYLVLSLLLRSFFYYVAAPRILPCFVPPPVVAARRITDDALHVAAAWMRRSWQILQDHLPAVLPKWLSHHRYHSQYISF